LFPVKADFKSLENYIIDKKEIVNESGRIEKLKTTLNQYIVQEAYAENFA